MIDGMNFDTIKGFLTEGEGRCLYETSLRAAPMGPLLEIGSYCGRSSAYIGSAIRPFDQVLFSIDHHRGSEEHQPGEVFFDAALFSPVSFRMDTLSHFRKTLERLCLEETVIPIVSRSPVVAKSWKTPLSFVFIDGGHAYDTVFDDYTSWSPHIMSGGYLLFHDIYENPDMGGQDPLKIFNLALASSSYDLVRRENSLAVLKKR